jgi:tetratricopeptide (TPR) repeat protein
MAKKRTRREKPKIQSEVASRSRSGRHRLMGFAGVSLLVALIYLPTLSFEFTNWDDPVYVLNNRYVQAPGVSGIQKIWTRPIPASHGDYIPVTILSYWIDYRIWGLRPAGYHLTNLLLHALASGLMFLLFTRLTKRPVASAMIALLFALHPMNTEAVTWVAERKSVMAMCWMLLCFNAFISWEAQTESGRARYGLSLLCYALACLSKTAVVFFPLVLMGYQIFLKQLPVKRSLLRTLPFFGIALLTSMGRLIGHHTSGQMDWSPFKSVWEQIYTILEIFGWYLKRLVLPIRLNTSYPLETSTQLLDVGVIFGLTALLAVGVVLVRGIRHYPLVSFGLLWYVAAWLPHAQIIGVPPALRADRYVYYSSAGLFLAVGFGLEALAMRLKSSSPNPVRAVIGVLAVAVICGFGSMTVLRNRVWADSKSLWTASVRGHDGNPMALCNLAMVYVAEGDLDQAISQYRKALAINHKNADARNNLAALYMRKGWRERAIAEWKRALTDDPRHSKARNNLGSVYAMTGRLDKAIEQFKLAVSTDPDDARAHYNLGLAYSKSGRKDQAVAHFKEAVRLKPDNGPAHTRLGSLLAAKGAFQEAVNAYETAIRLRPRLYRAYNDLAWLHATSSDHRIRNGPRAVSLATKACELTGFRKARALETLAAAYAEAGNFKRAVQVQKRAITLQGHPTSSQLMRLKRYESGKAYRQD